jgi:hypothetical protein
MSGLRLQRVLKEKGSLRKSGGSPSCRRCGKSTGMEGWNVCPDCLGRLDPRPDLAEDSELWERLLSLAAREDDGPRSLYGALDYLRCMGARAIKDGGTLRIDGSAVDGYTEFRTTVLQVFRERLVALLREAAS